MIIEMKEEIRKTEKQVRLRQESWGKGEKKKSIREVKGILESTQAE